MHAFCAYNVGMKKNAKDSRRSRISSRDTTQFTVRNVPAHVAGALRSKANKSGESLNGTLVEALSRQAGVGDSDEPVFHDLDYLAGKWEEDPDFDEAIAAQDRIDEPLWK